MKGNEGSTPGPPPPVRRIRHSTSKNPLWGFLGSLLGGIISVIISMPLYIPIILVLPAILAVRWLLLKIYNKTTSFHGSEPDPMSGAEIRSISGGVRAVMHTVLVLDYNQGLSIDQFHRILSTRVLPLYPRLTTIPISLPLSAGAGYCWIPDSQFSLSKHVFYGPTSITSKQDVQSYLAMLMEQHLPNGKPQWEFYIIPPRGDQKYTHIIARVHQSIGDGSELLRVLCHSLADSPVIDSPERPQFGSFSFGLNVLRACLTGPCTLLIWLWLTTADLNPLTSPCNCTGQVTLTWSATIHLPKVMRIKQVTRSTVNCVILSALAGAVRVLLQSCGIKQPSNVKVLVPVDIRSQNMNKANSTCLGNKGSAMMVSLPVSVEGCVPRLWATRATLASLNTSRDAVLLYMATAALMAIVPPTTVCYLLDLLANKTTIQYSSIPGPTSFLSIGGGRLKEMYCLLPSIARAGLSVTCVTYADQVLLSVVAESSLGPAAQLLLSQIEHQVEILWKLLLNRRVPGENSISCISFTPEIIDSPSQQIEDRISEIQKEVVRLNSRKQEEEFQMLKLEYCQLVGELKRRLSVESIGKCAKNTRSRSHSICSRLSGLSIQSGTSSHRGSSVDDIESAKVEYTENDKLKDEYKRTSTNSAVLSLKKHRKNSFEIIRFHNKKADLISSGNSIVTVKENEGSDEEEVKGREEKETDYSDSVIKLCEDDDCMEAGPINSTLRDLYCTNYLEYELQHLRQQRTQLTQHLSQRNQLCPQPVELSDVEASGGIVLI